MLPKINRITESKDFLRIFKTVRPIHTAHLAIRVAKRTQNLKPKTQNMADSSALPQNGKYADKLTPNAYKLPSRFGFVISNKIDKRSSKRNGLKRMIRAVIENNFDNIQPGYDVVVQVKNSFDFPYDFSEIEKEVLSGLSKTNLLK